MTEPRARTLRVGDAVADAVHAEGVRAAFGLLGEGNIAVVERFVEQGSVEWFAARREDAAVSMADGYARRSGRRVVGLATVTHGPGVTNALTALTEAARARTPLVVIAGDTGREDLEHAQTADEAAFVHPTGAGVHVVRSAATAAADVAIAFARARRERRPVVLLLPSDLADDPYPGPAPRSDGTAPSRTQRTAPDEQALAHAAARIRAARRPVILAGRGAAASGAAEHLVALADATGALLATTLLARGLFRGHPWDVGFVGGFGSPVANGLVAGADVVLAFGTSLSDHTSKDGAVFGDAAVIRFDLEPVAASPSGTPRAGGAVVGDAAACADALRAVLGDDGGSRAGYRTADVRAALEHDRRPEGAEDESGPDGLDPRALARELDRVLPPGRAVVVDLGYFTAEACRHVGVGDPDRFVFPLNFGSIGLALATAAGASVADRTVPTVALVGDGGLMASVGELETLRRHGLPVIVVVFDDAAYGIEYHALKLRHRDPALALFDDVDFAAVARGFGLQGLTVRTLDELGAAAPALRDLRGPVLVDAKINGKVETEWLRELVAAGWHGHDPAGEDPAG